MLSPEENAYLCEVEPGRPMHNLLKRYWIPAGLTADIPERDSDPVRITLLCRNFVMFRDSAGAVGILDDHCCHRGASLALGRVEEGGIRCIYHGWKFGIDGRVLDMPNVGNRSFGGAVRQPSYPVKEAGGVVWVYLGPPDEMPSLPHFPFFDSPETCRYIGAPLINCNFVQVLEGAIDSAHLGVLHRDAHAKGAVSAVDNAPVTGQITGQFINAIAPRVEVADASWGFRYAALRELPDDRGEVVTQARVTAFFFPFCSNVTDEGALLMAVPLTSEWTVHYHFFWKPAGESAALRLREMVAFLGWNDDELRQRERCRLLLDISGTVGRANNYKQDREAMRHRGTFSGMSNVVLEDIAVTETMGEISDRTIEHLVPSDAAVVRARGALIRNARRVADGQRAAGVSVDRAPAGAQGFVTREQSWQSWFSDWSG
jgi:phthalate 4,5-dioxygenase oxygenase subunit